MSKCTTYIKPFVAQNECAVGRIAEMNIFGETCPNPQTHFTVNFFFKKGIKLSKNETIKINVILSIHCII